MKIADFLDKTDKFESLSQREQTKLMAFFFCKCNSQVEFTTADISNSFDDENLRKPSNIVRELTNLTHGKVPTLIKKSTSYSFHRNSWKELNDIYVETKHSREISNTLRSLISKLDSNEQKVFLDEAIICFEVKCFRASIIMTWLLCMDILYEFTIKQYLIDFNNAIQIHGQYKKIVIKRKDDFSDLKESVFFELLRVGKIISGDVYKILKEKLDFRNTAAHPNTVIIKETKAIAFIEDLLQNVILKIQ